MRGSCGPPPEASSISSGARRRCRAGDASDPSPDSAAADDERAAASSAGSAVQSGSRSRIAASVSDTVSPAKRGSPREHLVEHAAERPDVGALVDRLPARLLRAHVGGGPEDQPFARAADRHRRRLRRDPVAGVVTGDRFRQAEVEHLHDAVGRDLDVGRLQIAVDDALARAPPRAPRRSAARSASASSSGDAARARSGRPASRPRPARAPAPRTPSASSSP